VDPAQQQPLIDHPHLDDLLPLLVCPVDHVPLEHDGAVLRCGSCGRSFPVEDGIPNLVVEDDR
jgi:uncharacterized protein YbaR (Trm112 family)